MPSGRDRLLALGLCAGLGLSSALAITPARVEAAAQRPDIIAVMVDDLGFEPENRILKRLPNIREHFVDGGMQLRRMYGQTPLCGPSRANFLTGQSSMRTGVRTNNDHITRGTRTIAVALRRAGYHTMMFGKYLNKAKLGAKPRGWSRFQITWSRERVADESASWVEDAPADRPLFAWFSSTAPHQCKQGSRVDYDCNNPWVPERYRGAEECAGIEPFLPPTYRTWQPARPFPFNMPDWTEGWKLTPICESLLTVDRLVGRVVQAQRSRGRPAYLMLLSDNGMAWGRKGHPAKHVPESLQLPMFIKGPGIEGGSKDYKLLSLIDVAPTFAELGEASLPRADGRSFASLLRGQPFAGRGRILEHSFVPKATWQALRNKQWHYLRWPSGHKELYRISADPWEERDLRHQRRWKVKQLDRKLDELIRKNR
jgi:N-acetylglucosamine-6-sulfatase